MPQNKRIYRKYITESGDKLKSSAAIERIFSTHSRIHTKDRNRLANNRVEKLVTVP